MFPRRAVAARRGSEGGRAVAPISVSALVLRFAVVGVAALIALAVATALVSRQVGRNEAVSDARRVAWIYGQTVVEPALQDGVADMQPEALRAIDAVVRTRVLGDSLIRVKIWRADGTIVYSDEGRLVGATFELDGDELEALDSGEVVAELSDLNHPENRYESKTSSLLEVYLRVETPNMTPLLFEAYFLNDDVSNAGSRLWMRFAPIALAALALLQVVQIPLAWSMARHLRRGQEAREQLLRHALESSETERRRIASDLHDGVVQDLTGVSYTLAAIARHEAVPQAERQVVEQTAQRVREGVRSIRSLMVDIYPPNLQQEGLESAIGDVLARLHGRGITATITSDLPAGFRHPDEVAALFYRATQEALRNIVTHAAATAVNVHLGAGRSAWTLRIDDNGAGFTPDAAGSITPTGHLGLRVVADLASEMGGTLSVESAPAAGTAVIVEVPQ